MSMKHSLLLVAPAALDSVSRPSLTVTVAVLSTQREVVVGVPLMTRVDSALMPGSLHSY
jgi:hypothetical protein